MRTKEQQEIFDRAVKLFREKLEPSERQLVDQYVNILRNEYTSAAFGSFRSQLSRWLEDKFGEQNT